jgi:hypothetical protein
MDGDPMASALMSAFSTIVGVAPSDRVIPVLRHALIELLDPSEQPIIPATIGAPPSPRRNRYASQSGLEAWIPLRDRVLAELARTGTSRRELAKQLGIAPGTLKPALLPRCRAPSKTNRAKFKRWLERRPAPVATDGSAAPQHNGHATTTDMPTKPMSPTAYRLTVVQREKIAGYRELDERSLGKSAGVALETVDAAIAGGRDLAPEIIAKLAGFHEQQQSGATAS